MGGVKKDKSNVQKKTGKIILLTFIVALAFVLMTYSLLEPIMLKIFEPYYFVTLSSQVSLGSIFIFVPVTLLFIFMGVIYALPDRKMSNKKYLSVCAVILSVALILTIVICGNVWVFNKDTISYNTLFLKNKAEYSFDDIKSAKMEYCYVAGVKGFIHEQLIYTLEMNDGSQIEIVAYPSFIKDDKKLIEFDKAIAEKRETVGEFEYFNNASDELNEYLDFAFQK